MANSGGLGGSFFRWLEGFWDKFWEWLLTERVPKAVQILVALFLFVAGIAFQSFFTTGYHQLLANTLGVSKDAVKQLTYIWIIILLYTVSAIVLTIVAGVWISSLNIIVRKVARGREEILDAVKDMVWVSAEYIADGDLAYERTQELVKNAKKRMIFVDFWVHAPPYNTDPSRRAYYQAITDRIKRHLDESSKGNVEIAAFFHERIVQMPNGNNLEDAAETLSEDVVYWEHIKTCIEMQKHRRKPTSVFTAEPFTRTHFAIIDDVFVEPILTTGDNGLKRYGAILYTDRNGELIRCYEELMDHLDKNRFLERHINTKAQTS